MTTDFLIEQQYSNAEDFLAALAPWSSRNRLDGYVFRGHSNDSYRLLPTAIRPKLKEEFWRLAGGVVERQRDWEPQQRHGEYRLLREFYRLSDSQGLKVPHAEQVRLNLSKKWDIRGLDGDANEEWIPKDLLEVAALAQHHGIHTRLLDWTYDPYVAAYFAVRSETAHNGNASVWCINQQYLDAHASAKESSFGLRFVTPPYSGNPNLLAQRGLFSHWRSLGPIYFDNRTVQGAGNNDCTSVLLVDREPLDTKLHRHFVLEKNGSGRNVFIKLTIPASQRTHVRRLLAKFGYGHSRIFPGYDGVAMQIKDKW